MSEPTTSTPETGEEVLGFARTAVEKLATSVGAVIVKLLQATPGKPPAPYSLTEVLTLPGGQLVSVSIVALPVQP